MDRIERAQARLGERTGSGEQTAVERLQPERVKRFAGSDHEPLERQT
ncbi:MAG TPA: hypothetical protein VF494_00200 [Candidatus Limnocylindrales bacterium]